MVRDGAARDRRPARRRAGHEGVRHPVRARPARLRGRVRAPDLAQRVPARAERRLCARADAPHRSAPLRRARRAGALGVRAPTQGAAALARGGRRTGRHPRGGARGARGHGPPGRRARRDAQPRGVRPARARAGAASVEVSRRVRRRSSTSACTWPAPPRRAARDPLGVPADHAGRRAHDGATPPAERTRSSAPASRARTSRPPRWPPFASASAGTGRRCGSRSRSTSRSSAGLGGGSADAAAVLRLAAAASGIAAVAAPSWPTSRCRSAPTCRRSSAPHRARDRSRRGGRAARRRATVRGVLLAGPRRAQHDRERLRARRRAGRWRGRVARGRRRRAPSTTTSRPRRSTSSPRRGVALALLRAAGASAALSCRARGRRRSACSTTPPRPPTASPSGWRGLTAAFESAPAGYADVRSAS